MKKIIETRRLYLREFTRADHVLLYKLDNDPEVMQYISTYTGIETTISQCKAAVERTLQYYKNNPGLGVWVTCIKETDEPIGWMTLKHLDETDEIEIGYRYLKKYWGFGYATEASSALVEYGFNKLNLRKITAVALPENKASIRVMEKAGLHFSGMAHYYGADVVYYVIENPLND